MAKKGWNANQLKTFALAAMTLDHLTSVVFPGYPREPWILLAHVIGRMAAPVFWFFVAEGFYYTRDRKRYAARLFAFAIPSHFAYNFAFGIPFLPFQTTVFNQTSVIWALAWGMAALWVRQSPRFREWQKTLLILAMTVIAFCADWSSIAVLAIVEIGRNRGNFRKQMTGMMLWVSVYALVYALFIDPVYGALQLFTGLTIPLLKSYNGEKGRWKGMKWFFYLYYPLHLFLCGLVRIGLHGNIGVMIGG